MGNYALLLLNCYQDETASMISVLEDGEEKSDSEEKENSEEKDDSKEKEIISQFVNDKALAIINYCCDQYPEIYFGNSSVYLEYTTPPPDYS